MNKKIERIKDKVRNILISNGIVDDQEYRVELNIIPMFEILIAECECLEKENGVLGKGKQPVHIHQLGYIKKMENTYLKVQQENQNLQRVVTCAEVIDLRLILTALESSNIQEMFEDDCDIAHAQVQDLQQAIKESKK